MSGREWQPGDVAIRTNYGFDQVSLFVECSQHEFGGRRHWHHSGGGYDPAGDEHGPTYRPLVVIDPEDMGDVERVRDACWRGGTPEDWQEYLRSLVASKPAEPTGLGAVVEDAAGTRWVRLPDPPDADWNLNKPWRNAVGVRCHWQAVRAVRVLSEGVTE